MAWRFYDSKVVSCPTEKRQELEKLLSHLLVTCYLRAESVLERLDRFFGKEKGIVVELQGDYDHVWKSRGV
jgi:hypothetical protein